MNKCILGIIAVDNLTSMRFIFHNTKRSNYILKSLMKGNLSQEKWQGEVCIITRKNKFCITSRNGEISLFSFSLSLLLTFLQRSNPNSRTGFLSGPPCFRRKRDGPCSKNNTADEFYRTHTSVVTNYLYNS